MSSPPAAPEHALDDHISPRKRGGVARRVLRRVTGAIVAALTLIFLLLPAAVFLTAGVWAIGAYGYSLTRLWSAVNDGRIDQFGVRLDALSFAGHALLASAGYFALVFALSVLAVGILGRVRQRFLIVSGLLLAIPSMLGLSFGLQASLAALTAGLAFRASYLTLVWIGISMYVLADAIVLGMLLADARPQRVRLRWTRRPDPGLLDSGPIAPMRFALASEDAVPTVEWLIEEDEVAAPAASMIEEVSGHASPDAPSDTLEMMPPASEDNAI